VGTTRAVILIDTSAWIAYLRGDGSAANLAVRHQLAGGEPATTDIVQLEILAGARGPRHLAQLRQLLAGVIHLTIASGIDAEQAAEIYRTCRRQGETPRQLNDCLIAAVAIRHDVAVLHADRDFELIARHTTLQTVTS
jgi:predicted nucleic acid-binding protein